MKKIIFRNANSLNIDISEDGATEIAQRSRGTPRIAIRLLKRVYDFAIVKNKNFIDKDIANKALKELEIDKKGFDFFDRKFIKYIIENYSGGPVGIETLAAGLSEQRDSLEDVVEPYLIQQGYLQRTPRGRVLTQKCFEYFDGEKF